jgi:SAM-dependent methyltransferase
LVKSVDRLTWELVPLCPSCGSGLEDHLPFEAAVDGEYELHYSLCRSCGLIFQSPRPNPDSLLDFYQSEYRRRTQGQEGPSMKDRRVQAGRARNLLGTLGGRIPDPEIVLDVGCSTGEFLLTMHRTYGARMVGIEPGDAYRRFAEKRGIEVFPGLTHLPGEIAKKVDLASLLHVLEHLVDPLQTLVDLREYWLREDGYLLVEVPNLYGHYSYELAHLMAFSPSSLRGLLQRAGYRVIHEQIHGQPRSNLLPLYLTFLAQAAPDVSPMKLTVDVERIHALRGRAMRRMRWLNRLLPRFTWKRLPELEPRVEG